MSFFSPTFTQQTSSTNVSEMTTSCFEKSALVMFDQTKNCGVYFLGILSAAGHQFDTVDLGFLSLLPRHGRFCRSELDQGNCLLGVDFFFLEESWCLGFFFSIMGS